MQNRLNYRKAAPNALNVLDDMHTVVENNIDIILMNLVYLRVSQINGCAYCIDMHNKDMRALGESEERIYGLIAWRETPFYTDRERAALAWSEAVTQLGDGHVPDAVFAEVSQQFSESELVYLNLAVVTINAYNRFAIAFRQVPGAYKSKLTKLETLHA